MIFVRSPPWVVKLIILLAHVLKRNDETSTPHGVDVKVFLIAAVYTVTSLIPSLVYSVRNRQLTTEYTQLTLFMICNIYILLCLALKDKAISRHVLILLQFTLLHLFYSQYTFLVAKPYAIHFSTVYSYLNLAMAFGTVTVLAFHANSFQMEKQDAVVLIVAMFAGEILGCLAYVQYILIKSVSEVYENLMNSIFVF